ncbi:MAG: hypothetical protein IAE95_14465 [Chitinophagaceae bacterium]|nr:hypothetical protein [Chitinophagaceae bacterium]
MYLVRSRDRKEHKAAVQQVTVSDLKIIRRSKRFGFDWGNQRFATLYKLLLVENGEILGLMAVRDRKEDHAIEIELLESAAENVGDEKMYANVAGCLIASACRLAFINGYNGFVCLVPKTALIKHYISIYGMRYTGIYLYTEGQNSLALIKKYTDSFYQI